MIGKSACEHCGADGDVRECYAAFYTAVARADDSGMGSMNIMAPLPYFRLCERCAQTMADYIRQRARAFHACYQPKGGDDEPGRGE